ncbi:MAG: hypothetical protein ABL993_10015 [Vicinamibacterales bacterium]
MSPILVRPVREQLEHDRVVRLLQARYKRKFEVAINPGNEHTAPVGPGSSPWYPDLVLQAPDRGRKLLGVVEVETAESVNNLEAMSQWAAFSRLRAALHLYVPIGSIDTARRLCSDLHVSVAELWTYQMVGDQMRFNIVQRSGSADAKRASSDGPPARGRAVTRPAASARRPATSTAGRRTLPEKARPAASAASRARATKKTKKTAPASRAQKRK